MAKAKQPALSAAFLLDSLEKAPAFACGPREPHVLLREVRNATGFARSVRSADGLLVSCWPSRGVYFDGIETKVSRSDWLSELKDPAKSAEIQRFCTHWWLVTSEGIVQPGELPGTWGHVEVNEAGKCKIAKAAPKLEPEAPSVLFVASMLRNAAVAQQDAFSRGKSAGYSEGLEKFATTAEELSAGREAIRRVEQLERAIKDFEEGAGVGLGKLEYQGGPAGRVYGIARRILGHGQWVGQRGLPGHLRTLADALEEAEAVADEARRKAAAALEEARSA